MLRSLLFVPADSARKLEKSLGCDADALIVDLEDSVAIPAKDIARQMARAFLDQPRGNKKVFVRVNAYDTGLLLKDLQAIMPGKPDGIVLPKCEGGHEVAKLGHQLDGFEACLGVEVGSTSIVPIVTETAQAVLNLGTYSACSERLLAMLWGAEDLAAAIGASRNRRDGRYRSPFQLVRDQSLLAAAAAGVLAIDAVFVDVGDVEGLKSEADDARCEGFSAKACIHPAHCTVINDVFLPSAEELAWAARVLQALEQSGQGGVATLDGKMLDKPHETQARRILQSAQTSDTSRGQS